MQNMELTVRVYRRLWLDVYFWSGDSRTKTYQIPRASHVSPCSNSINEHSTAIERASQENRRFMQHSETITTTPMKLVLEEEEKRQEEIEKQSVNEKKAKNESVKTASRRSHQKKNTRKEKYKKRCKF